METLNVTAKDKKIIKIRLYENNKVHGSDYKKLNDDNFEVFQKGNGFVDYKIDNLIFRKTFPTWIEKGNVYLTNVIN